MTGRPTGGGANSMARLSWPEYADRIANGAVVLVPVGALEQHGRHLPLGVDYMLAEAVALAAAEHVDAVVAPPFVYGYKSQLRTGGGPQFPGSVGLDGHSLASAIGDVLRGLVRGGADKLAIVDGHYENQMFLTEACDLAVREFRRSGQDGVRIVQARYFEQIDEAILERHIGGPPLDLAYEHAGVFETSLFLHLFSDLVDMDAAPAQPFKEFPSYDRHPPHDDWVPETGALSDPNRASAALGRDIFDSCVEGMVRILEAEYGSRRKENA